MNLVLPSVVLATMIAIPELSLDKVEKAYWDCEFAAVKGTIRPNEFGLCNELYEYLKNKKFSGNFDKLLVWWRQHKDHEMSLRLKRRQP